MEQAQLTQRPAPPLVVDLDGTLVRTDMLHESALRLLRDRPLGTLRIPWWLWRGKAQLKQRLAGACSIDPATLPYNEELVDWLRGQKAEGRYLVLCTASDQRLGEAIASHLGLFDEVLCSDGSRNLSGERKAQALEERFGKAGFDYAGNAQADLAVWRRARRAIVVNASTAVTKAARRCCEIAREFPPPTRDWRLWPRMLRVHQWLKNLLLLVPFLAAHRFGETAALGQLALAFFAFSLGASAVYLVNDLLDLESDRLHPRKRQRAFASGRVPAWIGVALTPPLLAASLLLGLLVGPAFLAWLLLYFAVTTAYSWRLKRMLLVDCLTLALLYTLRIIAGSAAVELPLSYWLLGFAVFLFFSLAFLKRFAELDLQEQSGNTQAHGRGYRTGDAPLVQSLGVSAGFSAALVLALYLNGDEVLQLYPTPELLWIVVPVLLCWLSWIWLKAQRGEMHDDPLIFALRDPASLLAGAACAVCVILASVDWPW